MTNPPNYRNVECCGNCRHVYQKWDDDIPICDKFKIKISGDNYGICDDYEDGGEE